MKPICFVMPYFGEFKKSVALFFESVRRNTKIDWLIITDNEQPINIPENIRWVKTTLNTIQDKARKKLNCKVCLNYAYRLCDFKPFYGLIFSEYLSEYEYWGYGDFDVIYGELFAFYTKIEYNRYDKINRWGHCTLIKNNSEMNYLPFSFDRGTTEKVVNMLESNKNVGFDEREYNDLCFKSKKNVYMGPFSADIDIFYDRMRCVDKKTMVNICKVKNVTFAPINYKHQIFVLLNGKVYRFFIKGQKVGFEEFAYIHFRKEVPIYLNDITNDTFIISRSGFFHLDKDDLNNKSALIKLINKYNPSKHLSVESMEHSTFGKKILAFYAKVPLFKMILDKIRGD